MPCLAVILVNISAHCKSNSVTISKRLRKVLKIKRGSRKKPPLAQARAAATLRRVRPHAAPRPPANMPGHPRRGYPGGAKNAHFIGIFPILGRFPCRWAVKLHTSPGYHPHTGRPPSCYPPRERAPLHHPRPSSFRPPVQLSPFHSSPVPRGHPSTFRRPATIPGIRRR